MTIAIQIMSHGSNKGGGVKTTTQTSSDSGKTFASGSSMVTQPGASTSNSVAGNTQQLAIEADSAGVHRVDLTLPAGKQIYVTNKTHGQLGQSQLMGPNITLYVSPDQGYVLSEL